MTHEDEPIPAARDIKQQLDRMLASNRFRAALNPASFLELTVTRALLGKKTTEDIIGRKLFGAKFRKDESTDVRVTASNLRKTLVKYYASEGRDDLVVIALPEPPRDRTIKLPPGEAYKPTFRYNPRHEVARKYRLGCHYKRGTSPYDIGDAIGQFIEIIALQPHHVAAHIALAESLCQMSLVGWESWEQICEACNYANKAVELDPGNWHAYAAVGAVSLLLGRLEIADNVFKKALALNKDQTLQYGWYHAFLIVVDRTEEALALARSRAETGINDAYLKAFYGAYLYLAREFDNARTVIKEAIALDENCWLAYLVQGLVQFSCEDAAKASVSLNFMNHALHVTGRVFLFPGLTSLFSAAGDSEYGPQPETIHAAFRNLMENPRPSYVQCALQLMSYGDNAKETILFLCCAWGALEPPILFLHLLPLFDRLRGHELFRNLISVSLSDRPKGFILAATRQPAEPDPVSEPPGEDKPEHTE